MDWQIACETLWGPDWISPASQVLGINRRTIERWRTDGGAPRAADDLVRMARRAGGYSREYGDALRRLAGGETINAQREAAQRVKRALARIDVDLQDHVSIASLAAYRATEAADANRE